MFMLIEQKDSISRSISSETAHSAELGTVIERLEKAARSIESDQQAMETSKVQISNLVIDPFYGEVQNKGRIKNRQVRMKKM